MALQHLQHNLAHSLRINACTMLHTKSELLGVAGLSWYLRLVQLTILHIMLQLDMLVTLLRLDSSLPLGVQSRRGMWCPTQENMIQTCIILS